MDLRNEIDCAENGRIKIKLWANVMCRFRRILVQPQGLKAELSFVVKTNRVGDIERLSE